MHKYPQWTSSDSIVASLTEEDAYRVIAVDGGCPDSCYSNGRHKVGIVPLYSLLDGGLPGDICQQVCLQCGRVFGQCFFPIGQPNRLTDDPSLFSGEENQ